MSLQQAGIPKEIKIERDPTAHNHAHYVISFTTGGQQPPELMGLFTTKRAALLAINKWKATKKPLRVNPVTKGA